MTGAFVAAALALTITSPDAGQRISVENLSGGRVPVTGKVSGKEPLRVTVNGKRAPISPRGWRIELKVRRGWNRVRVLATDVDGNEARRERRFKIVAGDDPPGEDRGVPRKLFTDPNDTRGLFDVRSGTARVRNGRVIHTIVFWDRLRLRRMIGPRRGQISVHIGGGPGAGPPRWEILITGHNGRLQSLLVDHATGRTSGARFRARRKTLKASIPKRAISRSSYAWHVDTGYSGRTRGKPCPSGTGNAPTRYSCADRAGFGKVRLR